MFAASKSGRAGSAAPTTDASFAYVPLLLETGSSSSRSTTVTDSAQTPNTVNKVGSVSTGWVSPYQTDGYWGNQFNGTTDYLTLPASAALTLTANFTIEFWVYSGAFASGASNPSLFNTASASIFYESSGSNRGLCLFVGSAIITTATTVLPNNQWNHVACVRSGSTVSMFVNGSRVGTNASFSSTADFSSAFVNRYYASAAGYLNGYMSNFRVVKGTAVYDPTLTTLTVPTTPLTAITNTSLLTCQSNRFIDNSASPLAITPNGTPQVNPYFYPSGFTAPAASPGAVLLNGSSQFLKSTTATTAFQFGTNPYTVECWLYQPSRPTRQYVCGGSFSGTGFQIFMDSGLLRCSATGIGDLPAATIVVPLNAWTHIAVVRTNTSAGGVAYYVNGVPAGTNTMSANISGTASFINVGTSADSTAEPTIGYIGNFRIVKGTAVYTGAFTPPSGPLTQTGGTYPSLTNVVTGFSAANTSLLLAMSDSNYTSATNGVQNNTFIDESNYAFPITRNGTPTQGSITPYWPNGQWSNYFNGSNAYLTSTIPALSGQFTIDFWLYRPASGNNYFFTIGDSLGSTGLEVYLGTAGTVFNIYSNNAAQITSSTLPSVAAWNYVAVTRDASNVVRMYLNGTQVGSNWTTSVTFATTLRVGVEFYNSTVSGYGNSYISNFRISNNVRTVTSVPTAFFVADGNTLFLGCQSNRFRDTSSNNATITPSGTPTVQAFQPFSPTASYTTALYGGSGYFNGSTDYLTAPSNTAFAFGTGDFTIECWINTPVVNANNDVLIELRSSGATSTGFVFNLNPTGIGYQLNFYTDGGFNLGSTVLNYNVWNHVAVTRSGTTVRLFSNGVVSATFTKANNFSDTPVPRIGSSPLYSPSSFNGYISNFRVVKGTAVYTGAFTPPTLAPISTTGPASAASYSSTTNVNTTFLAPASLLLNMANAGIYDAAVQNDVTTVSNAQVSTAQKQWNPSSIFFNGASSSLSIPPSTAFGLGTGDWTIEFWVYLNAAPPTSITLASMLTNVSGAGFAPHIYCVTGGGLRYYTNSSDRITGGVLASGVWNYVAVSKASGNTRMYINGTQTGSTYVDSNNYGTANPFAVADYAFPLAGGTVNGYFQDVRITKGVGRTITASPTAPFPTR